MKNVAEDDVSRIHNHVTRCLASHLLEFNITVNPKRFSIKICENDNVKILLKLRYSILSNFLTLSIMFIFMSRAID